jgi:NADH dehydrogenase
MKRYIWKKNPKVPTIVVVGAGFAGINFVKAVRKRDCEVVIIDKHNYHQFQPLLYQVAISGLEPDSIVSPVRRLFNQSENVHYVMGELMEVHQDQKTIELNVGTLEYDHLVIATGSRTNYYGNANIEKYAFGLKDINDALSLRSWVLQQLEAASLHPEEDSYTHYVVAGGGPAGIEMAGALAEFRSMLLAKDYPRVNKTHFEITLIAGSGPLLSAMSERAQQHAAQVLDKMGVEVIYNARVTDFDGNEVSYLQGETTHRIAAKTLIWTAGVTCQSIKGLSAECYTHQNRLKVDAQLRVANATEVYAIGDIAYLETEAFPKGLPMVAQTAIQQGRFLAKNLLEGGKDAFVYKDKGSMATIGMRDAVADVNSIFVNGRIGWFLWSMVHLISITSFRNRLTTGFSWLLKYLSYDKANQLIIRRVHR